MSDEGPKVLDLPVGLDAQPGETRRETDSMGAIEVPADRYWGAQTQRSLVHFSIGDDRMPMAVCHAYGYVKKAAATVNGQAGRLPGLEGGPDRAGGRRGHRRASWTSISRCSCGRPGPAPSPT